MNNCPFCFVKDNLFNTLIEETKYFYVRPTVGSIVVNYLLIIPKRHITSFSSLNDKEQKDFVLIINKYRQLFYKKTNKYPIIFEHGTCDNNSSSSIIHAHIHIVGHNYLNEKEIINDLNMEKIDFKNIFNNKYNKSYILYINQENDVYITYNFKKESQKMRKYIANDIGKNNKWNWKKYPYINNVKQTIKNFK